ncbi:hypothetical protein [Haloferula sp. BvORR071]|uniref:hypothetical protein n=1 Tax=Haloferula sp. BvORR071 TaxID=1396141 RepID=UPI00055476A1|nr:hypothetical protein [Haloferula sp. BvORR071]
MYSIERFFAVLQDIKVAHYISASLYRAEAKEKCLQCDRTMAGGRDYTRANCRVENPTGNSLPDFVALYGGGNLWSERVVALVQSKGLTGYRATEIELVPLLGSTLPVERQRYYAVDFTGRVEVSRQHFDDNLGQVCPACGTWRPTRGKVSWGDKTVAIRTDLGPLPDFTTGGNVRVGNHLCSRAFVDLVRDHSFTGFSFRPAARGLPRVDLANPSWFDTFREQARTSYPELLEE